MLMSLSFLEVLRLPQSMITFPKPTLTSVEDIKLKCDYFVDVQIWPLKQKVNPEAWLNNFEEHEIPFAAMLLNGFMYLSEEIVDSIYHSAFHELAAYLREASDTAFAVETKWKIFLERVILTYCTGETPGPTDSGFIFARKARQLLKMPEERIVPPERALELLATDDCPVVFVDDFVGSGNQFVETWHRKNQIGSFVGHSFATVLAIQPQSLVFYCPVVATTFGLSAIEGDCSGIRLAPAHILDPRYSALHPNSLIWPEELQSNAVEFLRNASARAGIPVDLDRVDDWRGFNEQGLALAFSHSVPDATLPIFYWDTPSWHPLIRRS
jgi:hypothetical protein